MTIDDGSTKQFVIRLVFSIWLMHELLYVQRYEIKTNKKMIK